MSKSSTKNPSSSRFITISTLKEMAKQGKTTTEMINFLKETNPENLGTFFVLSHFRQAFSLSVQQLQLLERAKILTGGSFDDTEINTIIDPIIKSALAENNN